MKRALFASVIILAGVAAYAATPNLPSDGNGRPVSLFAPNGSKDVTLTISSQTVDLRSDLMWSLFAPADCYFRTMSTATKAGKAKTYKGASWSPVYAKNPASPFLNLTGCTSGELQRH